jgi:hypothetical protein
MKKDWKRSIPLNTLNEPTIPTAIITTRCIVRSIHAVCHLTGLSCREQLNIWVRLWFEPENQKTREIMTFEEFISFMCIEVTKISLGRKNEEHSFTKRDFTKTQQLSPLVLDTLEEIRNSDLYDPCVVIVDLPMEIYNRYYQDV